jgi:hypothetical protein
VLACMHISKREEPPRCQHAEKHAAVNSMQSPARLCQPGTRLISSVHTLCSTSFLHCSNQVTCSGHGRCDFVDGLSCICNEGYDSAGVYPGPFCKTFVSFLVTSFRYRLPFFPINASMHKVFFFEFA